MPLVEVRNLKFRYEDGTSALNGVDFRLDPGEAVAVLGPNGSGETTFVQHLNGLLRGEGSIRICGIMLETKSIPEIRRRVGLVFQDSDSQLFMPTVLEDVAFGLLNGGVEHTQAMSRARQALEMVGLSAAAPRAPYHLSAGEKKRAAIAGIVVTEPEILVFDEPTANLDPPGQRSLFDLIAHLPQAKIVVTHDIPFARTLCRRAVFFQDGRVAVDGPLEEVVSQRDWDCAFERNKVFG